ncbi:MAG: LysM peptidoglycan-binding domain-containing protein [Firmicutes bacterium]|nr:LysM peptidoglycan-binding domain-containing protein [Bacillota bacterium]
MKKKIEIIKNRLSKIILIMLIALNFLCIYLIYFQPKAMSNQEDEYILVIVKQGQTLWEIASEYKPKTIDIRKMIYIIKRENELGSALIKPGQIIKIPTSF